MKNKKLLDEIGKINDKFIEEANEKSGKQKNSAFAWRHWVLAAACVAVAVIGAALIVKNQGVSVELPLLKIVETEDGYGFEGITAYDISELQTGNPWTENAKLKTLPVYKNTITRDENGVGIGSLSMNDKERLAKEIAAEMGLKINEIITGSNRSDDPLAYSVRIVCTGVIIDISPVDNVVVSFVDGAVLPNDYRFSQNNENRQDAETVTAYLLKQYAGVVNIKSPALAVVGNYDIYGQRSFLYEGYENSGSLKERILAFNFYKAAFFPNEKGELESIVCYSRDLTEKIGDYPIISTKKAEKLLMEKHYLTTVSEEIAGEEYIKSVELIYRTSSLEEIYMPYYKFLVELPGMETEEGMKTFGAFYVPAVEEKYLSELPTWDGSFQ